MDLESLKKEYTKSAKKHKLPTFKELNEFFEIYKVDKESDTLLRAVRKQMMEKVVNSLSFVEMLTTGANAPRMYFPYLKSIPAEDRKDLEQIYKKFSELIVLSLEREIHYSEKDEAELIRKIISDWKSVSLNFRRIMKNIRTPNSNQTKKERSYFG